MSKRILDRQAAGMQTPTTQSIMLTVLLALVPGIILYAMLISPMVIINIAIAVLFALLLEAGALHLRGVNNSASTPSGINQSNAGKHESIQDGSIALAATLLAIAVPPMLPIWQLLIGVFITVMLGKQVYGGLGNNPFNPAMVGYAALLISFPQSMTLWFIPESLSQISFSTQLQLKFSFGALSSDTNIRWDGITRATPLDEVRSAGRMQQTLTPAAIKQSVLTSGWLWVNMGFLIGGLMLLQQKIIRWQLPVSVIAGFLISSVIISTSGMPIFYSLFSGALMLGAFFIATDPVTAASSRRGQLFFGFGIGILTFVIREFGGYPEGFAFAVLLMNLCVPLIDHIDMQLSKPS